MCVGVCVCVGMCVCFNLMLGAKLRGTPSKRPAQWRPLRTPKAGFDIFY